MPRLLSAPFAIASDGTVLLNIEQLDVDVPIEVTLARLRRLRGRVFIGVAVTARERRGALKRLGSGFSEAAAFLVGGRRRT